MAVESASSRCGRRSGTLRSQLCDEAAQCQLVFEPAALTAGAPAQELKVTLALSDVAEMDPAQIRTLKAPEESGLTLTRVEGEWTSYHIWVLGGGNDPAAKAPREPSRESAP